MISNLLVIEQFLLEPRDSSAGVVTNYRLDNPEIEVRFLTVSVCLPVPHKYPDGPTSSSTQWLPFYYPLRLFNELKAK